MTLEDIANIVISDLKEISELEIIERIKRATGVNDDRARNGYKMMLDAGLLAKITITEQGIFSDFEKTLNKPIVKLLMDRLECSIVSIKKVEPEALKVPKIESIIEGNTPPDQKESKWSIFKGPDRPKKMTPKEAFHWLAVVPREIERSQNPYLSYIDNLKKRGIL